MTIKWERDIQTMFRDKAILEQEKIIATRVLAEQVNEQNAILDNQNTILRAIEQTLKDLLQIADEFKFMQQEHRG